MLIRLGELPGRLQLMSIFIVQLLNGLQQKRTSLDTEWLVVRLTLNDCFWPISACYYTPPWVDICTSKRRTPLSTAT